jgi:hypothetical protein
MTTERLDHAAAARARVATQYTESVKFLATLSSLCATAQELEDALLSVKQITDIDLSVGVQLDTIGSIIGISRVVPNAIALAFFGFADTPSGMTFGEEGASAGARFRDELEPYTASTTLGDPEFRLLIRAKIVKNHSTGTADDILEGMAYIFQGATNVIEDVGGMRIKIGIGRALTAVEKILIKQLDLLPRPAGVQLTSLVSFDDDSYFGFSDQPTAKGFGEESSSTTGGVFAEEF